MSYIGDFALESTFDTKFCTVATTGAPTTIGGTWSISVYVDNSTTQLGPATVASPAAGITITLDFDGVTGLHNVRVAATAANGYAAGSNYQIVVSGGTVGGTSIVGYVVAEFSIQARSALRPTTAGRTLDVTATGEAGIDWANIGGPTTTVNLSGTTVKTATDVETDTADIQSRLPAALTAGGNIKADALALSGDTVAADNAESFFDGTGYAGTNNVIPSVTTVTGNVNGSVGSVTGAVGSVTAGVTVTTNNDKTDYVLSAAGSAAMTEGYRANAATGTLAQLLYEIIAHLGEASIAGTTKTIKKIDHATTAETFTLNNATTPTSITRAT